MVCAMSSLLGSVGGGFFMFKQEQEKTAKKEFIAEKKAAPYVTMFMECDYKGVSTPIGEGDMESGSGFKSLIIPAGFSVDTYPKENNGGAKLTLGGPSDQKCTSIKSMVVTKV